MERRNQDYKDLQEMDYIHVAEKLPGYAQVFEAWYPTRQRAKQPVITLHSPVSSPLREVLGKHVEQKVLL